MTDDRHAHDDDATAAPAETAQLRAAVRALEAERARLSAELEIARSELARERERADELLRRLEERADHEALFEQYQMAEQQNSTLANLYVASHRLHQTLEREAVLTAIREIVINLIGSEEFVVYGLSRDLRTLELLSSFGIDESRYATRPAGFGLIGEAVASGEILMVTEQNRARALAEEQGLTACIPLKLGRTVIGVIAIFSVLPHKGEYTPLDRELFDLLTTQAAVALRCTELTAPAQLD